MNIIEEYKTLQTRRQFFSQGKNLLGTVALGSLLGGGSSASAGEGVVKTHFPAKAKRVIYLHMVGGPAQMDLFDHKPKMKDFYDKELPDSIRKGQRLTTMTSGQKRFPVAPSKFKFGPAGECGMMMNTELLPNLAKKADDICWMRTLHTEAINHEPAIAAMQTGNQVPGRPCLGSWASYGLGSDNENLPAFVVLVAVPSNRDQEQAISSRLWGSGYLPGEHAGVSFRSAGDPILYINNPAGVPVAIRKSTINNINALNEINFKAVGDPETQTRIRQYEMAFKMQASVPELTDLSTESDHTFKLYGEEAKKLGTFANTVLMARRLAERGVRFIQIYHNNWDHHGNLAGRMPSQCKDVDQPCAALIADLKQRGMFEDTLIIWGGEFGRTPTVELPQAGANQGRVNGRDHNHWGFSMWLAGGGIQGGQVYGGTDDFGFRAEENPVHVHDLHATMMHLLGFDHKQLTYRYAGRDYRLTDVHGDVKTDWLA
jgi:hypothetical protein